MCNKLRPQPVLTMFCSRVGFCKGEYPDFLMKAWLEYEYTNSKSNNDRPGERVNVCTAVVRVEGQIALLDDH